MQIKFVLTRKVLLSLAPKLRVFGTRNWPIPTALQRCKYCTSEQFCFLLLGPSALSLEEQRLLQSLDRLNERLRGIFDFTQTLTNQKSRTVSCWLLIGLNLYERI